MSALAALTVIHVVDLPPMLGPTPLVGVGYLFIIATAVVADGPLIARSHWADLGDAAIRPRSPRVGTCSQAGMPSPL